MSDQDQTLKKQEFLRQQIIDMGYDASHFGEFLNSKKPGTSLDVSQFTFDEISQYVYEF